MSDEKFKVIRSASRSSKVGDRFLGLIRKGGDVNIKGEVLSILDQKRGGIRHYNLKLTKSKRVRGTDNWEDQILTIEGMYRPEVDEKQDCLRNLHALLSTATQNHTTKQGGYIVVDERSPSAQVLGAAGSLDAKTIKNVFEIIEKSGDPSWLFDQLDPIDHTRFEELGLRAILHRYKSAATELQNIIRDTEKHELDFQIFLEKNPWVFGTEYGSKLERRTFTRDDQNDFVFERTTDRFLELIEIKTPLHGKHALNWDKSRKCFFPSSPLAMAIGQVSHYLQKMDDSRSLIAMNDQQDPLKVRGRIIIGRDEDIERTKALRTLNGNLHRIEIITYDQLLRTARRVIGLISGNADV